MEPSKAIKIMWQQLDYDMIIVAILLLVQGKEGNHLQSVLLEEIVIEPNVKLECVPKIAEWATHLGQEEVLRWQREPAKNEMG